MAVGCPNCGQGSYTILSEGGGVMDLQCRACGHSFTDDPHAEGSASSEATELVWETGPEPEDEDAAAAFIEATMNGSY